MNVVWYNPFPENESFDNEIEQYIHYAQLKLATSQKPGKRPKEYHHCRYQKDKKDQLLALHPERLYIVGHANYDAGHITGDPTPENNNHDGFTLKSLPDERGVVRYRLALTPKQLDDLLRKHEGLGKDWAVDDLRLWGCKGARDAKDGYAKQFADLAYRNPNIATWVSGYRDLLFMPGRGEYGKFAKHEADDAFLKTKASLVRVRMNPPPAPVIKKVLQPIRPEVTSSLPPDEDDDDPFAEQPLFRRK